MEFVCGGREGGRAADVTDVKEETYVREEREEGQTETERRHPSNIVSEERARPATPAG